MKWLVWRRKKNFAEIVVSSGSCDKIYRVFIGFVSEMKIFDLFSGFLMSF